MPNLTKTSLCKDLLTTGVCKRPDCLFAHSVEELRATNKFYKTSMCSFHRVGQCKLGAACRHAHDPAELADITRLKALTMDDAEMGGIGPSVRQTARRGGRKGREKNKKTLVSNDEEDDEFPDTPTWERTTTSPATLGWLPSAALQPMSPDGVADPSDASRSTATGGAASASQHSEEDDDLDDVCDMWARMKTVPAPVVGGGPMVALNRGAMIMPGSSMIRNEIQAVPMTAAGQLQMPATPNMWTRQTSGGVIIQQVDPNSMQPGIGLQAGDMQPMMMMQTVQAIPAVPAVQAVQALQVPCIMVPVPMQQTPQKGGAPGGYLDMKSVQVPCGLDMQQMAPEMQAKLLESAMPEVYED